MKWKLAEAKNRFSEIVRLALSEGPQHITRRHDGVVVMSEQEYERLTGKRPVFKELLLNGPGLEDLELGRDQTSMREADL